MAEVTGGRETTYYIVLDLNEDEAAWLRDILGFASPGPGEVGLKLFKVLKGSN